MGIEGFPATELHAKSDYPPARTPKELKPHQPALDGIRGIAIIGVLLTHGMTVAPGLQDSFGGRLLAYLLTPGWVGVDLFFVLSGFLITGILLSTKQSRNYFTSFYARRCLRISPIYYLTLTGVLLVGTQSYWYSSMLPSLWGRKVSYFFYLQNIWPFMNHGTLGGLLGHFWSLAVEEQFYLVWPILVLLVPERLLIWMCRGCRMRIAASNMAIFSSSGRFPGIDVNDEQDRGLIYRSFLRYIYAL